MVELSRFSGIPEFKIPQHRSNIWLVELSPKRSEAEWDLTLADNKSLFTGMQVDF